MTPVLERTAAPTTADPCASTRREFLAGTGLVGLGALSSCSADGDATQEAAPATSAAGATDTTPGPGRVVVLGEEYLLADLLALGITPAASTATVAEAGFQGLDQYDTADIRALPGTEANLELLASLRPTHIITTQFFADELGQDTLEAMAEVTVLPDGLPPEEIVARYGELFGRRDRAAELIDGYDAAAARAAEALDGLQVSVAAIYGGPSVAAFVAGPWVVPATLLDAGATLVPDAQAAPPDRNGRAYLSMERLDLLSAPQMVLLQSTLVDGEADAMAEVRQNPLWTSLPAVAAGRVTELDRLGYPGIEGRIRLIDDLIAALG